ncbi:Tex family protein [Maridesulfovibrio hydrothermalis]|uniref:Transcriptional accessory protein n=1 Tax=Maridesulfovibrio hydrothermalis AM13 = DSM 14728 TaxID=1121451 RepID=L0R9T1_9BACT|nr:Tex family protein [Maridesulfovibrio hydrothermalis]CCO23538.1 transcriptional accessory protein [Maridesulfovibrio hydrothermalis AM13 = DSM 14728]
MNPDNIFRISSELNLPDAGVKAIVSLLDEGATIPFISRYRKEATGSLDEVAVSAVSDLLVKLNELDKRRDTILKSIDEQGKLDDGLKKQINAAGTMRQLEDLYLPYKPKRKTKGQAAIQKGLEPLAYKLFAQQCDPIKEAQSFVSKEKGVESVDDALAGARDIIAEKIAENTGTRQAVRALFERRAVIESKESKTAQAAENKSKAAKFRDWFDWREPAGRAAGHRILALLRGERDKFLKVSIRPDESEGLDVLHRKLVRSASAASKQVEKAATDSYKRLLAPQMETELRARLLEKAETEAIKVFASNLREILLAPPLGSMRILALDPGFRTGAKLVCLDAQGALLHNDTIYPVTSEGRKKEAAAKVVELVEKYNIEAVAIGNGTAGRETEQFVKELGLDESIAVIMVNESGASVYSASEIARDEFPDHDITVRGAVSIGRRLMDPLAELVKIDPKSIGVGQYQHDVDQKALAEGLDRVVESCVNMVGVELNTASARLLQSVSGLGPVLAANVIKFRDENGPFASRKALLKVPRLGPKAFEQCAGFLRIRSAKNPLDATAVHPERYKTVEQMAESLGAKVADLINSAELRRKIKLEDYISDDLGLPTLEDIMKELEKPGRDPRRQFEAVSFDDSVKEVADLRDGMVLNGVVTNVTAFGAFVDVGVHQDGLVHISRLADQFVKNPAEVVHPGLAVKVKVLEVDLERKRISLSMRESDM